MATGLERIGAENCIGVRITMTPQWRKLCSRVVATLCKFSLSFLMFVEIGNFITVQNNATDIIVLFSKFVGKHFYAGFILVLF